VSLTVSVRNALNREGRDTHHVLLEKDRWNHVVWEFPDVARDRVEGLSFGYLMNGSEPDAADVAIFDIDHVELQRVEADPFEGWSPAPGRIAFCHTGYLPGARKRAIANGLVGASFELLRHDTGQPVLDRPLQRVETLVGRFQILDFSEVQTPGVYRLRADRMETLPFRIGQDVWERTIWKAVNFFYCERCGAAIPGVHALCHADWQAVHGTRPVVINGGWHDAGDLSQGLINTSEAVVAMLALAERLEPSPLRSRLIEEAKWGLDWVLKTSFRDGHRVHWATLRFWTNGKVGDVDDVMAKPQSGPDGSFYAAAAEAVAARVLKTEAPELAEKALAMAQEDWKFGCQGIEKMKPDAIHIELASIAALASLELHAATGEAQYGDRARTMGAILVRCQQRELPPGIRTPITGYFHRTARRGGIQRYMHRGHEQAPVVALARLCRAFPEDAAWMDWFAAVALHAHAYQAAMATFTAPYRMLPNTLCHEDEARHAGEKVRGDVREQILSGFRVGGGYHVRVYPVQPNATFRGNYGTLLSQTKAVATAAHLLGDTALADLCQEQLEWVVGRNPFGQSTMYGEGYDYAPQYTARSGDIVGSLPVGMKSRGNRDLPYWPATNVWNYKEVWVHPVSRWLWLMADLAGPAVVRGTALRDARITFRNEGTGAVVPVAADAEGGFRAELAQGAYEVRAGGVALPLTVLPGGRYDVDVRPDRALGLSLSAEGSGGRVTLTARASGSGRHRLVLRVHNLKIVEPEKTTLLRPGVPRMLTWAATIVDPKAPWVATIPYAGRCATAVGPAPKR
ncbi:glycoside hydrolase family 9 protein, partial [bacterium]|nr:glycoside hydrolase family 9 protein [bacterium]